MAPPVAMVQVILQDRPGEIAAVGHALQTSKVDVRDLQLGHAVHGGGGVLSLSVRPGEAETLAAALVKGDSPSRSTISLPVPNNPGASCSSR